MKKLGLFLTLTILASCGKGTSKNTTTASESPLTGTEESIYAKPKTGILKTASLNYKFQHAYEELSISSNPNDKVLGDRPFFIFLDNDNSLELNFYSSQDVKKISYLNLGDKFETTNKKELNLASFQYPLLRQTHEAREKLLYGKPQLSSLDMDMLNKVFLVETEAGDGTYVSRMKIMFWIDCLGSFKFTNKDEYSCGQGKLKFNYKLLEYELNKLN